MGTLKAVNCQGVDITVTSGFPHRHSTTILHDVSFATEPGRITGLLGPSGSGKTTLMRALVGVQSFTGTIDVFDEPAGSTSLRGRIGYVTQSASIYDDLSVHENLQYFSSLAKDVRGIAEIMEILGIAELSSRRVSSLSGGQRSRVSLGCALIATPELLVMDEPTVGLDPITRQQLWEEFRKVARDGASVIISSHVMEEAARCDDLILLRDGHIIWTGTPAELLGRAGSYEDAFLTIISEDTP
ncbi:ABC transporter ATPase [Corynebacterium deserti GIMN1.010]|uniref:ABC transporter ATPase n=1 Tax=Corynebacterium deserti GIMN1.010 TaxID=931089 RepID=A0A0M4CLS1_9CORY|nr:ABC transporter ATP-binding protein [Corynebacterium deserti]ALC05822.1 ABC transporter ATPase [Corynebacterium deserti GIMN1.010]